MARELRFDDKVVIVTGAGNGLGRAHALLFGSRGAKVVVNDLGGGARGEGQGAAAADAVVAEIKAAGGEAAPSYDSVEDGGKIVQCALDHYGRVDAVVNNAGIIRDVSFPKMTEDDWELIYRVHLLGAFRVTHAAWPHLREQGYGRVVMTASAAGLYGNFGQANYSTAKLGLVGFAQTLALEGRKRNIHVNVVAPIAGSRLTETVLPPELCQALKPDDVSPLVAYLCHDRCEETGGIFEVGGGFFSKLRWQRTAGRTFRVGRAITVEDVANSFGDITSFEGATNPVSVAEAMQPIMANIQAGPSKGRNQYIDVDQALGHELPETTSSYDERTVALYALGIGAGQASVDPKELRFVYELHRDGFIPLPTFGVIPAVNIMMQQAREGVTAPGLNYGFERILHGEQYTEVTRPLPPHATLTHRTQVKEIFDKGKHALVVTATRSFDESGEELIYNEITTFIRGAGGFGGERGPSAEINVPPEREPDATISERTSPAQALLYRLSGDWNPLHADPDFAQGFGFERPILHGLCTFGHAGRHVIKAFCDNDPRYFKSIKVRFANVVFPGETLVTEMWKESDTRIIFRCKVAERDKVVVSNAAVELYREIPKPRPKGAAPQAGASAAPAPAAPVSAEPTTADIFAGIGKHLAHHPELVSSVATTYLFRLTSPDSAWSIDLKNAPGKVAAGAAGEAECTLELSDADFFGMATGKLDPQKLYFSGKLKISGNIMASQKLEFLKQVDPALVLEAAQERAGGAPAPAAAAPDGADTTEPGSADIFVAIRDHLERHPDLVKTIGTVYQFRLTEPDSVWTVDLKHAPGGVTSGAQPTADCTLELSDRDFMGMTSGELDPQKLYFSGKLKISGNIMASQKLQFLQQIDPEEAKAAIAKARAAGTSLAPAAGAAAPSGPGAGALFEALAARLREQPQLAAEVGTALQFRLTEPESAWVVDLRTGPGLVREGESDEATTTLTLTVEDLVVLARGQAEAEDLHLRGRLRVDGDVAPARQLGLLKGLL